MFSFYPSPFPHVVWDGLSFDCPLAKLDKIDSDLFSFFQSKELKKVEGYTQLFTFILSNKELLKECFDVDIIGYDCFMSEYRKHCYLLPHDDRLEDRKVAWLYYLEQATGGDLLLYNSKDGHPTTIAKRIESKKGRMVLFKVSKDSWHAVDEVESGVRRAMGGWLYEN